MRIDALAERLPGKGLFGWLGRQVGHVKKAVQTQPAALSKRASRPSDKPRAASAASATPPEPAVIYREGRVEEAEHPNKPGVKLRRTIIDEVIVNQQPGDVPQPPPPKGES